MFWKIYDRKLRLDLTVRPHLDAIWSACSAVLACLDFTFSKEGVATFALGFTFCDLDQWLLDYSEKKKNIEILKLKG